MKQAEADEIGRSLGKRHRVTWHGVEYLVVNVSRLLAEGMPVASLSLTRDFDAPLMKGGIAVGIRHLKVVKQ